MKTGSRIHSVLLTSLVLVATAGSGIITSSASANDVSSLTHTSPAAVSLTASDLNLSGLKLGEPLSTAQKLYGKPAMKTILHGNGAPVWIYKSRGLTLYGPKIWSIILTVPNTNKTARGIHIGSTEAEVLKAYPNIHVYRHPDGDYLILYSSDRQYLIAFNMIKERVNMIFLEKNL